jgi:DNA-binding transcriptional LysR family regulator
MDWDRLRIFHAAASAGSFTHAGQALGLSQSAVSRQVSALEQELQVPLFHRHARGLMLTEHGEALFQATREMTDHLDQARIALAENRERPYGNLRVTTTVGLGTGWLAPRLGEFLDLYPEITVQLILTDDELDLAMRQADVAIRLRQPSQQDIIQRRLFSVNFHAYASPSYLDRFGRPQAPADLDHHRLVSFGGPIPPFLQNLNWLATVDTDGRGPRTSALVVNNLQGLKNAIQRGAGIGVLPDYLAGAESLERVLIDMEMPVLEAYFAYAEELRAVARVRAFRDFLLAQAARWGQE